VKITKIEPQKRNKKRSSIYINGAYRFGLGTELVLKYNLQEGAEIGEEEIENILFQEEKMHVKERAYKILRYRDRSARELKQRLIKLGFDESLVNDVIQDFCEDKTLDDIRLAQEFVSDYTRVNLKGNRFIVHELKKKGVPQEVIEEVITSRDEKTLARTFLEKKLANLNTNNPKERQKVLRRLLTRGFTPGVVYDLLREESPE
jgi:regulatory protein